ncbi:MAG: hypothetical protein LBR09_02135 [Endomicrobium sp.]|jgi:hypothetical protein|nr:hypothetical protein [Endomicrobium sp.]
MFVVPSVSGVSSACGVGVSFVSFFPIVSSTCRSLAVLSSSPVSIGLGSVGFSFLLLSFLDFKTYCSASYEYAYKDYTRLIIVLNRIY